jgi:hypothetical protein
VESCKLRYFNSFEFFDHTRRGRDSGSCLAISHIYKDAWSLAQAKGLPSPIYHHPAQSDELWLWAATRTIFLTLRERTPPGPSNRATVAIKWITRTAR